MFICKLNALNAFANSVCEKAKYQSFTFCEFGLRIRSQRERQALDNLYMIELDSVAFDTIPNKRVCVFN